MRLGNFCWSDLHTFGVGSSAAALLLWPRCSSRDNPVHQDTNPVHHDTVSKSYKDRAKLYKEIALQTREKQKGNPKKPHWSPSVKGAMTHWPWWMTSFSSLRLAAARSTMRWSMVLAVTKRYTITGRVWPMRWHRSWACRSHWGFWKTHRKTTLQFRYTHRIVHKDHCSSGVLTRGSTQTMLQSKCTPKDKAQRDHAAV